MNDLLKRSNQCFLLVRLWIGLLVCMPVFVSVLAETVTAEPDQPIALRIPIQGAISPVTAEFVQHGFDEAAARHARVIVLEMDTPGGLDQAMRSIIQQILSSPIPVITYVSPSGARAASAGAYILYASHIAAMAPGTNLGAATPVQIGGGGLPGQPKPKPAESPDADSKEGAGSAEASKPADGAMERKMVNDAAAYIKSLAQLRNRDVVWAERFVRDAASLSAEDALEAEVIDLMASDLPSLLQSVSGRSVLINGQPVALQTEGLVVETYEPDWRIELLSVIANPNVAYILILLGIYGLIFEFYNPGFVLPGVIGAICLLMALYALQVLPVNYAGLGLILLGVCFMIAELFAPSFGILGMGGLAAFVIGSIFLIDTDAAGYGVSLPLILSFAAVTGLFFFVFVGLAVKARSRPVVSGIHNLIGKHATVQTDFDQTGLVRVQGELWNGVSRSPLRAGQSVRIVGVEGLTLQIEPEEKV